MTFFSRIASWFKPRTIKVSQDESIYYYGGNDKKAAEDLLRILKQCQKRPFSGKVSKTICE